MEASAPWRTNIDGWRCNRYDYAARSRARGSSRAYHARLSRLVPVSLQQALWAILMADLPDIRPARHDEADRLASTLTLALSADPSIRWGMPDAKQYISVFMPLVGAFGGRAALDHRTAHIIGNFL